MQLQTEEFKDQVDEYGRRARGFFVATWGTVLKKLSTWAAWLVAVLTAAQAYLQTNTGEHSYYAIGAFVLSLLIPVLANIRQKGITPPASTDVVVL